MAKITLKGNPVETVGNLPAVGSAAPGFTLTKTDLTDVRLQDFSAKFKILNIVPSLDTGVCSTSAKKFNDEAARHPDVVVLNVSCDLPQAAARFCDANKVDRVVTLSVFRQPSFGNDYGVRMTTGPMAGLLSRAVVVLDQNNRVVYTQQVPEIAQEPDYAAVWQSLKA